MPVATVRTYYYAAQAGPTRNGVTRDKRSLYPDLDSHYSIEDLASMAEQLVSWGEERYANDHGSREDHLLLLTFVSAVMRELESP